jgi:hypothetical protein
MLLLQQSAFPIAFANSYQEFSLLLTHLSQRGLFNQFTQTSGGTHLILSVPAWELLEESGKPNAESDRAFVAMWFAKEMTPAYTEAIVPAIEAASYVPIRIDNKDHNNKIDDEIIAEIRQSRFLVADFTGGRGGVYFEAGFARGMGLDVIWTCRSDDLKNLHFDTRQFNHIEWTTHEELKEKLRLRILATIGKGPRLK